MAYVDTYTLCKEGTDLILSTTKTLRFYQKKFYEIDIINMLEFLIDNIFDMFGGRVFLQTVGILQTVILFSPTCSFVRQTSYRGFSRKKEKKLTRSFIFTFRYIDDVLSLNSRFNDFVDRIYPIELEIKHTTDTDRSASYLDIYTSKLTVRGGEERNFKTKEMISIFPL